MRKFAVTMVLFALFPCGLTAARLILRDGSVIVGQFLSGSPNTIVFRDDHGMERRFQIDEVQTIDFSRLAPAPDNARDRDHGDDSYRDPGRFALLQPGTPIAVRTDQAIDSRNSWQGIVYPATIVQDVVDRDGRVVIPRGTPASMVIRQLDQGPLGGANLMLDLDSVRLNGHRYHVASTDVVSNSSTGLGANRRTGEMVGGGAALGTLLGALAGGGKGAAIGAAAGAVTGGGVEVLTKGHDIRVPAESVLNFRLDRPLELREIR